MPTTWGIEEYRDIESRNPYAEAAESGNRKRLEATSKGLQILARDHSRLPFQWDESPNAGFTTADAKSWMRVHDDFRAINASQQAQDPNSILSFYKRVLQLRKTHREVVTHGSFKLVDPDDEHLFAYVKEASGQQRQPRRKALVVLNMSRERWACPDPAAEMKFEAKDMHLLVSTIKHGGEGLKDGKSSLSASGGRVYVNARL